MIVDLSNGTAFQKNVFSIAAYILDIKEQYLIDINILASLTKDRGFLSEDILNQSYIPAPDCTCFDKIAYLNITEITRYKRIIKEQADKYVEIDKVYADRQFFTGASQMCKNIICHCEWNKVERRIQRSCGSSQDFEIASLRSQ